MVHKDHEHRDDAQQLDAGIPLPPHHLRFGNVPVRRVWRLCGCRSPRPGSFVHNSPLVCGLSSLRILHTQTDWDILLKDKIEQMFECVVYCR